MGRELHLALVQECCYLANERRTFASSFGVWCMSQGVFFPSLPRHTDSMQTGPVAESRVGADSSSDTNRCRFGSKSVDDAPAMAKYRPRLFSKRHQSQYGTLSSANASVLARALLRELSLRFRHHSYIYPRCPVCTSAGSQDLGGRKGRR